MSDLTREEIRLHLVCRTDASESDVTFIIGSEVDAEKEEAIFNPNCRNVSLLSVIRDKCYFNRHVELELSDENGQVKNLRDKPQNYASDILREREVLVLLKVNNNSTSSIEDAEYQKYTPLLNDEEAITDAFLAQLSSRSLSRPSSRRARSNTSQGRRTPVGRSSSNRAPPSTDTTKRENTVNNNANNTSNNGGNTNRKGSKTSDGRSSRARTKSSAK